MLKLYSPSGREEEIASYIIDELRKFDVQPKRDNAGNVIAEIGLQGPRTLLCGHMDTVSGIIPVRWEKKKIYGRGAVDAKGSLAAMIGAFGELSQKENPPNIVLACVVDEERNGRGIEEFLKKERKLTYAVFGEPSMTDNLILGYKGMLKVTIRCTTETGHSAAPWLYENAIEEGFKIWKKIKNIKYGESASRFRSLSNCLVNVTGGGEFNKVPSESSFIIDFRLPPGLHPTQLVDKIRNELRSTLKEDQTLKIDLQSKNGIDAYETSSDSKLVKAFSIAIRKIRGKQPTYLKKTGTSDINVMAKKYSIPIIAYGPGNSKLDHSNNEYIEINDFLDSITVYKEALIRLHSQN